MTPLRLYVHALRTARPRQLRARALRPLQRRRFGGSRSSARFRPVEAAVALWRSRAFARTDEVAGDGQVRMLGLEVPFPPRDWQLLGEARLRRFHLHYGEEVLGWARRGETAAARRALHAWIAANPPRRGDAWHPYPLSTRVGNWIAALSLHDDLVDDLITESLRRQLAYLAHNIEDDVLGNHVVRNARALVLGGAAFDDFELLRQGMELLRREVAEQVLPDGGHYERSPVYHLIVLRDLLESRAAAAADWLDRPIEQMSRFAAHLTRPDGVPALFNDGSAEFAPALDLPVPSTGLTVFPDTGYAVLRGERVWLAFDCGPPSPPFLPAHAHADVLSVQLWVDGLPVVVDPGTFTYEAGPDREWFRSTRAHATVAVGGRDQFECWGSFRAGPLPSVRLLGTDPLEAEVETAWYRHRRTVRVDDRVVVFEDEVRHGSEVAVLESSLPLAPAAALRPKAVGPAEADEAPGWLSERMLDRVPLEVCRSRLLSRGRAELGWEVGLPSAP